MAEDYFPFDSGIGANSMQDRWNKMARSWVTSGIVDGDPAQANGDYGLSTNGLQVSIGYRAAAAESRSWVRGFMHRLHTAPTTFVIPPNASGVPRVDRIVLRRDLAAQTVKLTRLQGQPNATPTAPALTRNPDGFWDEPLWQFWVPINSGTVLYNVADCRAFLTDEGLKRFNDHTQRDNHYAASGAALPGTLVMVDSVGLLPYTLNKDVLETWTVNGAWSYDLFGTVLGGVPDSNGVFPMAHGQGRAPQGWGTTLKGQQTDALTLVATALSWAADAVNIAMRLRREDSHAYFSNPVNFDYWAHWA